MGSFGGGSQFGGVDFGGGGFGGNVPAGGGHGAGTRPVGGLTEVGQGANDPGAADRAAVVVQRLKLSYRWMQENFHPQWTQVYKSYKCERDPEKKNDRPDEDDLSRTSIGMPDTWSVVRKLVARTTAQIPNLRFNAKDPEISELIGRTLMYQWDKARVQRVQKKHVTQAALFGWSVRPWYWASEEFTRQRRVNPLKPDLDDATLQQISDTYGLDQDQLQDPNARVSILAKLLANNSRGGMLPVKYQYKAYEGPKTDFLFVGDVFPEPNFTTLQRSKWFIVQKRWDLAKIEQWVERFPEFAAGFQDLIDKFPDGTTWNYNNDESGLRRGMLAAIDRSDSSNQSNSEAKTKEWTVQEQWVPGARSTLTLVGERSVFLGEIENPYSLDGLIPFTELVLIDDILSGVGDSTARVMRGLQLVHDRQVNARLDLANNLVRPYMATSDDDLFENAESNMKRLSGFRLLKLRSQGDLWPVNESSSIAAMGVAMNDESAIQRNLQSLTGETNMSMAANVDPSQGRTATGARIMAYNQDILTKDLVDAFNESSLNADAEMMFLLNRSELADAVEFQASKYRRTYAQTDDTVDEWVSVEPELFQMDGEITVEIGSTLADDDEAKVTKATTLFHSAMQFPQNFNQQKATQELLIAMGKGRELSQWAPPQQGPPPEPPMNKTITVSAKWESLTPQEKQAFLNAAHVQIQLVPPDDPELQPPSPQGPGAAQPAPGGAPGGPISAGPPTGPEPAPTAGPEPLLAASALAASKGNSPLANAGMKA